MSAASAVRTFEVRHVQLARALFAAVAAVMITFSPDHSAAVGMSVFSGYATATAVIFLVSAWLVHPAGRRAVPIALGAITLVAAILGGIPVLRTPVGFFAVVIGWAAVSGAVELVSGIRGRRTQPAARDEILIGAVTLALVAGLLLVNPAYSLEYFIAEAGGAFTLTGITIGVGLFGGYAAIVAVFLGIAGFSPRRDEHASTVAASPAASAPSTPSNPEVAS
ncbi:acyl-CoA synthetase [Microbacterium thalli]|uniref:Acyl-CoA synthetase n=1 Tax=Microbacterium thalli TaxID=3027921 RepID=A0ABT5SDB2_9MICO|nr:acyl-CoA synthetase [Microbacterium thalli]MDD7928208.1 acyl-CoA synthetase [Microbacterium thalli]MDD7960793.1 acyl-CoA synthetase [Microbacterium thalli]